MKEEEKVKKKMGGVKKNEVEEEGEQKEREDGQEELGKEIDIIYLLLRQKSSFHMTDSQVDQ